MNEERNNGVTESFVKGFMLIPEESLGPCENCGGWNNHKVLQDVQRLHRQVHSMQHKLEGIMTTKNKLCKYCEMGLLNE